MACSSEEIPSKFVCPLTLNVMTEPVMTKEGHSYERSAILTWLSKHNTSPLTREPLYISQIVPNCALKTQIQSWRELHRQGWVTDSESEFSSDDDDYDEEVESDLDTTAFYALSLTEEVMDKFGWPIVVAPTDRVEASFSSTHNETRRRKNSSRRRQHLLMHF
jgi:hypothetical protein